MVENERAEVREGVDVQEEVIYVVRDVVQVRVQSLKTAKHTGRCILSSIRAAPGGTAHAHAQDIAK